MFAKDEATGSRRVVTFKLVDRIDNLTPELGIVLAAAEIQVSKNGAAFANALGVSAEIGGGGYSYEFTAADLDTVGNVRLKIDDAAAAIVIEQFDIRSAEHVYARLYDGQINVADFGSGGQVVGVNGTRAAPVQTPADMRALADALGYRRICYLDSRSQSLQAVSWDGYQFNAEGTGFGTLIVTAGTSFNGTKFSGVVVAGVFPAGSDSVGCREVGLVDVTLPLLLVANNSGLSGTMVWTGGLGIFRDCFDTDGGLGVPFVFDMNDLPTPLAPVEFRRFAGSMGIHNMTAGGVVDINLNGGTVTVDATCTNGAIKVTGEGRVINNSALVIDTSELLNAESVAILRAHKDAYVLDGGPGAANVVLDAEGLMLTGRVRVFRTEAEAAAATKGAADGADGEIAALDVTGANTGVAGQLANMDIVSQ